MLVQKKKKKPKVLLMLVKEERVVTNVSPIKSSDPFSPQLRSIVPSIISYSRDA